MIIKYKLLIIGILVLLMTISGNKGFCQSYINIDLDKVSSSVLPQKQQEDSIPDGMLNFNEIIKIKSNSITSYKVDYIPIYKPPIISKGNIFINLDNVKSIFNLNKANIISNDNKNWYNQYLINEFSKKKYTKNETYKAMFGEYPSKTVNYLISIDQAKGDTLWEKTGVHLTICQANTVSYILNEARESFIIDNKTGKELFKLTSSKPLGISEAKEDNGYLYLITGSTEKELIAINMQKGEVAWKVKGHFNKFLLDETRIYTSNQCAIDKKTGKLIWSNSSDIWIVGIVGNYLIGYLYGEDDPEIFVYNKNSGKLVGYLWYDEVFCNKCFGYGICNPEFIFAEQGEGNLTAAMIKCADGIYLCTFEIVGSK